MRIAFYAPLKPPNLPVPSGDRRVARLLLAALRQAGHTVQIASRLRAFEGGGDARRQAQIKARGHSLARRYIAKQGPHPPDLWFTYHLYHKAPDWLGPAVSEALSIPYVVAEASIAPKQAAGPWAAGHAAVCQAVGKAARILSLSPDDIECLEPFVDDADRLIGLPPFLDTRGPKRAAANRASHRVELAARLRLPRDTIWVAATAMMRPGDKLDSYRILGRAKRTLHDLPLTWLIAGDGPARSEVEHAIGADDAVFLGALNADRINALHAAADLAVWPAVREAFGMALLEAQATGLPVVAGHTPGVAQIVADGTTGLLTPVGNDTMLAAATRRLIEDQPLRERMRVAAMKKVEQEHGLDAASARLDRILREAART